MEKKSLDCILERLPDRLAAPLQRARGAYEDKVTEIVLRARRELCIYASKRLYFISEEGLLTDHICANNLLKVSVSEMDEVILRLCDYSVYAYQHEINSGFITIAGGVRVGLCGKAVLTDGRITNVRDIGTLNFRVARDIQDCSLPLLKKIDPLKGVLICGVPASGKTTLIRDMARRTSYSYRVSLLDERGELSAFSRGGSGFSLGLCDIYAGYPKGVAANCAMRSMAPDIIVCDEMGDKSDVELLLASMRAGVAFVATVHAASIADLRSREITAKMIATGAFRYVVFLSSDSQPGQIDKICEMSDVNA